jgi:hypothetical protein
VIEKTLKFRQFQVAVEAQARAGGIVILSYHARAVVPEFFSALVPEDGQRAFLTLLEADVERARRITPLIIPALLRSGNFSFQNASAHDRPAAMRNLDSASIRAVLLHRHCKVPRELLLDLVALVEAGRREGISVVFVLATNEAAEALIKREPALQPEASCITVPALSSVEVVNLLQHEGLAGSGAAMLGRHSNGDFGIVLKVLAAIRNDSRWNDVQITRADIERSLVALGLHRCPFSEEEWRMMFDTDPTG